MLRNIYTSIAASPMLRKAMLTVPLTRTIAWRFVAGENLDAGLAAVRELNRRKIKATLNLIGTHVRDASKTRAASDAILEALSLIRAEGLDSHLSVKLTQIGLDIDEQLCRRNLLRIVERASALGIFVRIDMEESAYTGTTIEVFNQMRREFGEHAVGIVLQSYLRDGRPHLRRLAETGARIRLVKGGYREPAGVAYRVPAEIDAAFDSDIRLLMKHAVYPVIATHDDRFIALAKSLGAAAGRTAREYEFQMLRGVRENLQDSLTREGYTMRCYVPYGTDWTSYVLGCARRLIRNQVRGTIHS